MDILRHFFFLLFLFATIIPCSTFVFLPSLSGSAPRVDSEIIMWCNPTVDQTHPVCDRTKIHSMPISLSLTLSSFRNFHRASASFNSTGERSYFIGSHSLCRVPWLLQPFFADYDVWASSRWRCLSSFTIFAGPSVTWFVAFFLPLLCSRDDNFCITKKMCWKTHVRRTTDDHINRWG